MPAIRSHHWPSSLSCSPPERPTERLALSRLLSKFATQPAKLVSCDLRSPASMGDLLRREGKPRLACRHENALRRFDNAQAFRPSANSCMSSLPFSSGRAATRRQLSINCVNRRRPIDSKLALDGRRPRRQIQGMTLLMHRVDPGNNAYRFYALSLEPTLFGDVALVRRWGRIGTRGRQIIELHPDEASASTALQRHRLIRLRHGYRAI